MTSGGAILLARLLICAVLAVAGFAKLADLSGFRRSTIDFGVPASVVPVIAWLVPLAELVCAAALLSVSGAWWGAIGASSLISLFILAIVINLIRGRTPDCRCFGQVRPSRIGWTTVARNVVLLAVAGLVVSRGPNDMGPEVTVAWSAVRDGHFILPLWAIALLGAWVLAGLWLYATMPAATATPAGQHHQLAAIPPAPASILSPGSAATMTGLGLPLNTPAPAFALNSLGGDVVSLDALTGSGTPLLLVFTRPNCPSCDAVLPDAGRWQREHGGRLLTMIVSKSGFEANREKVSRFNLADVLIQEGDEVFEAYGVQSLPSAVLVADGRIASAMAEGRDAIRALVAAAVEPDIVIAPP